MVIIEALTRSFPCPQTVPLAARPPAPPGASAHDCTFAGVVPDPMPVTDAQRAELARRKARYEAASFAPGNYENFVSYGNELEVQRATPEPIEIIPSPTGYSVVGKSTGRLYRFVPTNCQAPAR